MACKRTGQPLAVSPVLEREGHKVVFLYQGEGQLGDRCDDIEFLRMRPATELGELMEMEYCRLQWPLDVLIGARAGRQWLV